MKLFIKIVASAVLALGLVTTSATASCLKEGQEGVFVLEGKGFTRISDGRNYMASKTFAGALKMAQAVSSITGHKNIAIFKVTNNNGITRYIGVATSGACNESN